MALTEATVIGDDATVEPIGYYEIDFLGDITGPGGNAYAVFGAVKTVADALEPGLYDRWRARLDATSVDHTYDDLLEAIIATFGPQAAIDEYRDHIAGL